MQRPTYRVLAAVRAALSDEKPMPEKQKPEPKPEPKKPERPARPDKPEKPIKDDAEDCPLSCYAVVNKKKLRGFCSTALEGGDEYNCPDVGFYATDYPCAGADEEAEVVEEEQQNEEGAYVNATRSGDKDKKGKQKKKQCGICCVRTTKPSPRWGVALLVQAVHACIRCAVVCTHARCCCQQRSRSCKSPAHACLHPCMHSPSPSPSPSPPPPPKECPKTCYAYVNETKHEGVCSAKNDKKGYPSCPYGFKATETPCYHQHRPEEEHAEAHGEQGKKHKGDKGKESGGGKENGKGKGKSQGKEQKKCGICCVPDVKPSPSPFPR